MKGAISTMSGQHALEVGNATILLNGATDPFSEGHSTGYLEFYDERHRPAFPLTSYAIRDHLVAVLRDPSVPSLWRAGRITGWMEALMENAEATFVSIPIEEYVTVFSPV